jgi:alpha-glucosidase
VDIDGLDEYQNFTWHKENFPDPERFVKEKLEEGIHLIPIVDVAIRKDEQIPEYVTGAKDDVFCRNDQGEDFVGYVWPGTCLFPDYFQEKTRKWFGHAYQRYLNMGVHGFWNDMNEPAVFAEPDLRQLWAHVTFDAS